MTVLDVANEVMERMGGHVPMKGGSVNGYEIVKVVLEVLQDRADTDLDGAAKVCGELSKLYEAAS